MEQVNSKYIIQKIFSLLKTNSCLSIISYNNNLQKKLDVSFEDYKLASNVYIIQEKDNTKIFQKYTNNLIFEGQYEKGKKIKGREYRSNQLYFIGEYKNNLKYKGEILNENGKKIFKGEFNKGLYWTGFFYHPKSLGKCGHLENGSGIIQEFNFKGYLLFEGEYKNGFKYSGIEYNSNKNKIYEGKYKNNLRWTGEFYTPDQTNKSEIKEGNGKIEEYDKNGELTFKGELKNGYRYCGLGTELYEENEYLKLDAEFNNYNYIKGIYHNIDGYKEFEGKFKEEKKLEGIYYKKEKDGFNNSLFYGQFKEGKKYKGIEITEVNAFIGEYDINENYLKGKYYQGDFDIEIKKQLFEENDLKEINKEEIEQKGIFKYEGEFKNGLFHKGKEYKYEQIIFEGEYKNGFFFNGIGHRYKDKFSNKMEGFEGTYINGAKKGKEILYDEQGNIIMEKNFKDEKNWDYVYYDTNEVIEGEIINGNSEHVIECKIYIKEKNFYDDESVKIKKIVYKYFEGSYKNNEKYIGKEYDQSGNILFEGEFKEGKYHFGKEYYITDHDIYNKELYLLFEGEYKNGNYYKGKEYYVINKINDIYDPREIEYDKKLLEKNFSLKFEGTYKEGKKLFGWEYNLGGELIFVGEYKSGLYWNGYFYCPGELTKQKKSGFIKEGNCPKITLYGKFRHIKGKGKFINGNFYKDNFGCNWKKKEKIIIRDIALNEPFEKEIIIKTRNKGLFIDGKYEPNGEEKKYIINDRFHYEIEFKGKFKEGKYYEGEEVIYKKELLIDYSDVRCKRIYKFGRIKKDDRKIDSFNHYHTLIPAY